MFDPSVVDKSGHKELDLQLTEMFGQLNVD
jgi:fructosamine-3-kinase